MQHAWDECEKHSVSYRKPERGLITCETAEYMMIALNWIIEETEYACVSWTQLAQERG
jgi:hypothetical protein